jgi:hypothetical protein
MTIGRIYKIVSLLTEKVYIGSTVKSLEQRLKEHKNHYKCYQNGKSNYVTSYELVKYTDATIELIEEIEYINKRDLHIKEKYYIQTIDNVINKYIPTQSIKECKKKYHDTHKDESKKYYIANADKIKEKKKEYYVDNVAKLKQKIDCTCGGKYTYGTKSKHTKSKKHINYININITINNKECEVIINNGNK